MVLHWSLSDNKFPQGFYYYLIIIIIIITLRKLIIIVAVSLVCEFSTPALADGFSLKFE